MAPERLDASDFLEYAQNAGISMVTIDEAHCISQWGQDFRPSYAKIPDFIAKLKIRPVVLAFTATASPRVREDILLSLKLNNPQVVVAGFDRGRKYQAIVYSPEGQRFIGIYTISCCFFSTKTPFFNTILPVIISAKYYFCT